MDMIREIFGIDRRNGFSLVELLIVLAVIAALIAVVTPIGINAMRKSAAVAVARDLKTLSQAFANKIYLDGELPQTISELGRNVDSSLFGAAWKIGEDGQYNYFVFTNREADFETVSGVLVDSRQGIPFGVDDYAFLDNGLGKESMNSRTLYYNLLGAESIAPLTPFGSTFAEISSGLIDLLISAKNPRTWSPYQYTDLGLNQEDWENKAYEHIVYKPVGNRLQISPETGYKLTVKLLYEDSYVTISNTEALMYNIRDDNADKYFWYYKRIAEGKKVDISTIRVYKATN
ncbi:type II secretion system protein [Mesotoga sp. B105.6.4]|uniref:type II secretion system protein n=1 Tax=Mesotoga sp. B105.6.4 TaxID=1582224 RepID=UPI000CCC3CFE|nr:type II secretion system protein [Mesotoga sp. B105.6.4]PNS40054.1 N-terminal cleavage protein [Mesotoga sp. B105.6.4]